MNDLNHVVLSYLQSVEYNGLGYRFHFFIAAVRAPISSTRRVLRSLEGL